MDIELYINSSQSNVLSKNITIVGTSKIIEPFNSFDLLSPSVLIDYNEQWLNCNYAYIPQLKRYYYIEDITLQTAKRVNLRLRNDALMSFKDDILTATATVLRNEQIESTNVVDNQLPIDPKEIWYEGINFPVQPLVEITEDSTFNYVLVVRN